MNKLRILQNAFLKYRNSILSFEKENLRLKGTMMLIGGTTLCVSCYWILHRNDSLLPKTNTFSTQSISLKSEFNQDEIPNKLINMGETQDTKTETLEQPKEKKSTVVFMNDSTDKVINGIPTEVPYLIIGGGIAGMSAARTIRANDPLSKILIINDECQSPGCHTEKYPPYRRILLSKYIWKRNEEHQKALLDYSGDAKKGSYLYLEPDSFFISPEKLLQSEYGGISLLNGHKVERIDPKESVVTLESSPHKIAYKVCLIATGSSPKRLRHLEISENTNKNLYKTGQVSYFRSLNDFRNLSEKIQLLRNKETPARIMIIGSGLLGTELTSSLSHIAKELGNLEVIEVFKEKSNLYNILPEPLSDFIYRNISKNSTKLIPKSEVISINEINEGSESGRIAVSIKSLYQNNENFSNIVENVDHVIIAAGVEPEVSLAEYAGLEIDKNLGGFLVNSELQAREGIYVAGDPCSFYDVNLGRRRVEHWNHSEESGSVAGHNMVAYVLKSFEKSSDPTSTKFVDNSKLAYNILKPKIYNFQSSFTFKLNIYNSLEALGLIDSNLETKTFIATDFFDDEFEGIETEEKIVEKTLKPVKKHDPLDMPGVVFYLRNQKVVGILLWNVDDDLIVHDDFPSPLRSNVARKILSEQRIIHSNDDFLKLAADFDLSFYINSQYKFLEDYAKKSQEKDAQSQKDGESIKNIESLRNVESIKDVDSIKDSQLS